MSDFERDLERFTAKLEGMTAELLPNVASALQASIVSGSPLTGAPGQPVDTGNLRASWNVSFPSADTAQISTNVEYAPYVEDNVRGVTFRVGGPHGVKLTLANAQAIVNEEARRANG